MVAMYQTLPAGFFLGVLLFLATIIAQAQTNTRITSFTPDGKLAWTNALTDHNYRIQSTRSLAQPWTNFGTSLQGTGATMRVTVTLTNNPVFYRIADLGSCCTNNGGTNLASAFNLGTACADLVSSTTWTSTGCGNAWFRFRATNCDHSLARLLDPSDRPVLCVLTSPPGSDYDLYIYATDGSQLASSTHPSGPDTIGFSLVATQGDASVDRVVEVRKHSGAAGCSNWTLTTKLGP